MQIDLKMPHTMKDLRDLSCAVAQHPEVPDDAKVMKSSGKGTLEVIWTTDEEIAMRNAKLRKLNILLVKNNIVSLKNELEMAYQVLERFQRED